MLRNSRSMVDANKSSSLSPERVEQIAREVQRAIKVSFPEHSDRASSSSTEHRSAVAEEDGVSSADQAAARRVAQSSAPLLTSSLNLQTNVFEVARRLLIWLAAVLYFLMLTARDVLLRQDSPERRAVRLRETLERVGGTAIKIGQQLSIRMDLLPYIYCQELAKMLDQVAPFAFEEAVHAIESATGQSIHTLFASLDPVPVGSASIACVYQGVLRKTGEKVAVKVRRPRVVPLLAADLRTLDVLFGLLEGLTLLRPGFSRNLREELRTVLTAELDFRKEARFQEIFGQGANQLKDLKVTVPAIYYALSGENVLVQEYVEGVWVRELLDAVERQDTAALAHFRQCGIDPAVIARNILHVDFWSLYESLVFHADPHPANLLVRAGNELVFIDFGACGMLDAARRGNLYRFLEYQAQENVWGMAQAFLTLMEPLPAVDVNVLVREVEAIFYTQMLAFKSPHSQWYERSSAGMWLSLMSLMAKYRTPLPMDVLLFVRATLLYDTLALRLSPGIDLFKEFQIYARRLQQRSRDRVTGQIRKRLIEGLQDRDYALLERLTETGQNALQRLQRLSNLPYDFAVLPFAVEKGFYAMMTGIRFFVNVLLLTVFLTIFAAVYQLLTTQNLDLPVVLSDVVGSTAYQAVLFVFGVVHLRYLLFRLQDQVPHGTR